MDQDSTLSITRVVALLFFILPTLTTFYYRFKNNKTKTKLTQAKTDISELKRTRHQLEKTLAPISDIELEATRIAEDAKLVEAQAIKMLSEAQEKAETLLKESQEQAAQILEYSKTQAKRIASDAFDAKASLKDDPTP